MIINRHASTQQNPRIADLARCLEPNMSLLAEWWNNTGIAEFGDMTPQELVSTGKSDVLEWFLRSILRGDRE
ncbi:hypothetical protein [Dyella lipolytica]|uniref:Antitoxin Xre/MbcA/ParS-like toxin-binding domain-containing protein n=1 Tax=Dyella lipolytica TaxID=1867835 RepID=A0ABW8IYQ9_9GAMM|nr:hypothetical protein [Dyella lipolytica]